LLEFLVARRELHHRDTEIAQRKLREEFSFSLESEKERTLPRAAAKRFCSKQPPFKLLPL